MESETATPPSKENGSASKLKAAVVAHSAGRKFARIAMEQHEYLEENDDSRKWVRNTDRAPANYVQRVLKTVEIPSLLHRGVPVEKITSGGKFKPRVLTISVDRFAIFLTHRRIHRKTDNKKKKKKEEEEEEKDTTRDQQKKKQKGVISTVARKLPLPMLSRKGGFTLFQSAEVRRDFFVRYIDVADLCFVAQGFPGTQRTESSRDRNRSRLQGYDSKIDQEKEFLISITYKGNQTLDIVCRNKHQHLWIVKSLQGMMRAYHEAKYFVVNEARLLRYIWYDVDYNQDGLIAEKEFVRILNRINLHVSYPRQVYRDFLKQHNIPKNQMTYQQCMELLYSLEETANQNQPRVATAIWESVFGKGKEFVTAQEFLEQFLHGCQQEDDATVDDVLLLFDRVKKMEVAREPPMEQPDCLSQDRFANYLHHIFNDAFDPDLQRLDEDTLTRPLSEYWINTSHNTYLTGDQLRSASSVEMYLAALRRGCKCLELDCWDGETVNGQPMPVVLHGGTLTSKILFLDIIDCIRCYMDLHPDTYPIILSLENHCSHPFQEEMARILKAKLGTRLYAPFDDSDDAFLTGLTNSVRLESNLHVESMDDTTRLAFGEHDELPSPKQLQGRVIIKGKIPPEEDTAEIEEERADNDTIPDVASSSLDIKTDNSHDSVEVGVKKDKEPKKKDREAKAKVKKAKERSKRAKRTKEPKSPVKKARNTAAAETEDSAHATDNKESKEAPEEPESTGIKENNDSEIDKEANKRVKKTKKRTKKDKVNRKTADGPDNAETKESDWGEERKEPKKSAKKVKISMTPVKEDEGNRGTPDGQDDTKTKEKNRFISTANITDMAKQSTHIILSTTKGALKPKKKHKKTAKDLAAITLLAGVKYKKFNSSIALPSNHMHSIGETKIGKLVSKYASLWRDYNLGHMTRTYPAGTRVDSSNYNPLVAWSVGCQLVALNFQTSDTPLLLNDGRFRQNGGCGYVWKPESVLYPQPGPVLAWTLQIRVLSGSCLPKPRGEKHGEFIDPYVQVTVHDVLTSGGKQSYKGTSYHTSVIDDNGYCPAWLETSYHSFRIESPQVAMLQLSLLENDVGVLDETVAAAVIPINCLREGYRSIMLYDLCGGRSGPFNFATLLVEIQLGSE